MLCHISISRRIRIRNALQIFPVYQTLDAFLDHVHVWHETGGQLPEHFGDELCVC